MDLEKQAIDILRAFASDDPYQLAYSGGKGHRMEMRKDDEPMTNCHRLEGAGKER